MTQQLEARAFAIWRYAEPREWDVSYEEIADATGLTYNAVNDTIYIKRWGGKIGGGRRDDNTAQRRSMTKFHKIQGHNFDYNALDVVDLMAP